MKIKTSSFAVLFFGCCLALCAFIVLGSLLTSYFEFNSDSRRESHAFFVVERGKDLRQIARKLAKEDLLSNAGNFAFWTRVYGNAPNIRAGEFDIPPHASPKMIMNIIVSDKTVIRKVTISEGLTGSQIINELDKAYGLTGDANTPDNGTVLPSTYYYSLGDTKRSVISKMEENLKIKAQELWEKRAKGLPLKSLKEAVILASIVEREATLAEERPLIASVFINRLKKRMKLQSDPTVIYAITNGNYDLNRRVLYKDLKIDNPFNTYVKYGLPPAPICNPGLASIAAVLNPTQTDFLYFVADNRGGHIFSNNYRTHTNNVNKMRKKIAVRKSNPNKTAVSPAPTPAKAK